MINEINASLMHYSYTNPFSLKGTCQKYVSLAVLGERLKEAVISIFIITSTQLSPPDSTVLIRFCRAVVAVSAAVMQSAALLFWRLCDFTSCLGEAVTCRCR